MDPITLSCRAILFDLDGVLVDSRPVVERTWLRWAAERGIHVPDLLQRAHGRRTIETLRDVAPMLDIEAEARWLAAVELADSDGLEALPGAIASLQAVSDSERAIVTSGGRAIALLRLGHVGLSVPAVLVTAEDVREGKPAPDGYVQAAAKLGVDPADCVVIEDTTPGIAAGRAAGAMVIAVATTFPAAELRQADIVVPSLAALQIDRASAQLRLTIATSALDAGGG